MSSSSRAELAAAVEECKRSFTDAGPRIWATFPDKVVEMSALYERMRLVRLEAPARATHANASVQVLADELKVRV